MRQCLLSATIHGPLGKKLAANIFCERWDSAAVRLPFGKANTYKRGALYCHRIVHFIGACLHGCRSLLERQERGKWRCKIKVRILRKGINPLYQERERERERERARENWVFMRSRGGVKPSSLYCGVINRLIHQQLALFAWKFRESGWSRLSKKKPASRPSTPPSTGWQFNGKVFGLSFSLKNGWRLLFDSVARVNYSVFSIFLV